MKYTDYFWDFDGTLYNTYPQMTKAFVKTLEQVGVVVDKKQAYQMMRQKSLGETFDYYLKKNPQLSFSKSQLRKRYQVIEQNILLSMQPFAETKEVCRQIVAGGGRNFLLTHRDQSALKLLQRDGLFTLFTDFVTAQNHFARKPNPESLNYLLDKNEVDRSKAVMVGDRKLDVLAGHNAQIAGILFDYDDLLQVDFMCERKIKNLNELLD
ncbi:HAD-IA family hydrolase [Ligilactobacillus sp. Marseille-Q7487]|jgi:HAD superfamily hydrolase (TIGR01549 family)|uniref:HAD-IA family hydrolase n=1 Tax=Ligilactobacillus sp. Marseille-Q7487 TaxID=3022128 RepID=UPI0015B5ADBA|nr:HAD-IA family hydrolase [Ligilactobacillus sp. Marseille-Q7487]